MECFNINRAQRNLCTQELYEEIIKNNEGILTKDYALRILTGKYTGRSPKDKFIVDQPSVHNDIDWGLINQPVSEETWNHLYKKVTLYLEDQRVYVKECAAGADPKYQLKVRLITQAAYHALFADNMFIRLTQEELQDFEPDFTVIAAPYFKADPQKDGLNSETFILVNFEARTILIGGTLYSGEVKKGIFSVMNYLLPKEGVLSMHCSASINKQNQTDIFFGLSGTGKTTLSAGEDRLLIGDDEHGWSDEGIFNIEGGCYAKTINLTPQQEPLIYAATQKPGTILENVVLNAHREPDFADISLTQNTRCSYPIHYIEDALSKSVGDHPSNVVFLTCDAFGVLPPISRLTYKQAIEYFICGYTSKVAGTERGIVEPEVVFSPCYGAPFMPLRPKAYAKLLQGKLEKHKCRVWLINTGWTGGPYGVGKRIALKYTRQMLKQATEGHLDKAAFKEDVIFGLNVPLHIEGVPDELLNPIETWTDPQAYQKQAFALLQLFERQLQD